MSQCDRLFCPMVQLYWQSTVRAGGHSNKFGNHISVSVSSCPGMPARAAECVALNLWACEAAGVNLKEHRVFVDGGQRADRAPVGVGVVPCITPNAYLCCSTEQRRLQGREVFAYQGLHIDDYPANAEFPEHLLRDLAGNAFAAPVFLMVLLAVLTNCSG
jgi:hypothetical protein